MRILVLGGTSEGRRLAQWLSTRPDVTVTSSLAGRTANPMVPPGGLRTGGFGGIDGLVAYLSEHDVDAVIDATHPFAGQITAHAVEACRALALPLLLVQRPAWQPQRGDRWVSVASVAAAAAAVEAFGRRVFLTVGRQELTPFAALSRVWFLIRSIDPPAPPLPPAHQLLLERGPFTIEHELEVLRLHRIDVVVSKNSGGPQTYAKIAAARQLGLPVIMVRRPPRPPAPTVDTVEAAQDWVRELLQAGHRSSPPAAAPPTVPS